MNALRLSVPVSCCLLTTCICCKLVSSALERAPIGRSCVGWRLMGNYNGPS